MIKPYYQDKWVAILKGDCREILPQLDVREYFPHLTENKVDLVLTDPPYFLPNTQFRPEMRMASRMWSNFTFAQTAFEQYLNLFLSVASNNFEFYLFTDELSYAVVYPILYANFYQSKLLVWDKQSIGLGGKWRRQFELLIYSYRGNPQHNGSHTDIIQCKRVKDKEHPYEKPEELIKQILNASQTNLILDPFVGSGTTCFCAKKLNRYSIGIEIEEKYCEIAARRCSQEVMELTNGQV